MKKPFNELNEDAKATYGLNGDTSSKAWLYCTACGRAMEQGECVVDDAEGSLHCAYKDCASEGNLAFESLYGWDAYRQRHGDETADWPETPSMGECYRREGAR